jgi:Fe-S-cluster-containing hydrogenase component 2
MACPYGVISPSFDIVDLGRNDFALAIKCDFCPKRNTPACVEACPDYVLDVSEISE